MSHKEIELTIEHFYNGEDSELRVSSKREMLSILQGIATKGTSVALYYDHSQHSILTRIMGVSERGMWLDVGSFPPENKRILLSDKVTFVSLHQQVKIQFESDDVERDIFGNSEAFYLGLPEFLLRIQRREFYRTPVPFALPVKCLIPFQPEGTDDSLVLRELPLMDISVGGIGLLCEENEITLQAGKIFENCRIMLPGGETLTVTLEVRDGVNFTTPNKIVHKRVGCSFINLNKQMDLILQRYITRLQSGRVVR